MLSCYIWVTWPLTYDMTFLRWLKKLSLMVSEMKSICYIVLRSTDAQQIHESVNRSEYVQGLDSLLRHCVCHWVSLVFGLTDFPTQEPCGAFPIALLAVTLRLLLTWEDGSRPGPWFGGNMRDTRWEQLCLFRQNVLMSGFLKGRELQTSHEFLDVEGGSRAWEEGYYCV